MPAVRFQGNWIPHKLRAATEDGVFFVGDSAGHCLPLTAEGIRPAFYFALALGRELRQVLAGRATRAQALERYGALQRPAPLAVRCLLAAQHLVGRATASAALRAAVRAVGLPAIGRWAFQHYLAIAPPQFAQWRRPAPAPSPGAPGSASPPARRRKTGGAARPGTGSRLAAWPVAWAQPGGDTAPTRAGRSSSPPSRRRREDCAAASSVVAARMRKAMR